MHRRPKRPVDAENFAQAAGDQAEKFAEQFAGCRRRRATAICSRSYENGPARSPEIFTLASIVSASIEPLASGVALLLNIAFGFRTLLNEAAIDQRYRILAAPGSHFKTCV